MHITVKRHQDIQSEILNELHEIKEMLSSRESSECGCKCHDSVEEQPLTGGIGVIRYSPINTSVFQVSDQISVFISGEYHTATAIEKKGDLTLFLLDDCLETMLPMIDTEMLDAECSRAPYYINSGVCQYLTSDCTIENPAVSCRMVSAKDWYGDTIDDDYRDAKLFILSESELINPGLPWIQTDWKRRIATRCNNPTSYWTRTAIPNTSEFAVIDDSGSISFRSCEEYGSIRPAFVLRDNVEYKPNEEIIKDSDNDELPEEISEVVNVTDNVVKSKCEITSTKAISKLEAELRLAESIQSECFDPDGSLKTSYNADIAKANEEYILALKLAIKSLKYDATRQSVLGLEC